MLAETPGNQVFNLFFSFKALQGLWAGAWPVIKAFWWLFAIALVVKLFSNQKPLRYRSPRHRKE